MTQLDQNKLDELKRASKQGLPSLSFHLDVNRVVKNAERLGKAIKK